MAALNSCNTQNLALYTSNVWQPWNMARVRHITRRLGYGLNAYDEKMALAQDPQIFIDEWLNASYNASTTAAPAWGYMVRSEYTDFGSERREQIKEWHRQTYKDILSQDLLAKMTLFWHNHFVTEIDDYRAPSWMYQYYNLLQRHAFGNFKELVKAIGKNEAMLVYLNGSINKKNSPNENYARELFELFTLGEKNGYTQQDIVEASRALTGYVNGSELGGVITFRSDQFDNTDKTIFGKTANFDHDSLIDHLFEVRKDLIAKHIVQKIYRAFVSPVLPSTSIIDQLSQTFIENDWELQPLFDQLFKSKHFLDDTALSTLIKSPIEIIFQFIKENNFTMADGELDILGGFAIQLGQELYNPVDVAGWQGDQSWINNSTLPGRWQGGEYIMDAIWFLNKELLRTIVTDSTAITDDVELIAKAIIHRYITIPLQEESDYNLAITVFKGDIPNNYFDDRIWNTNWGTIPLQTFLLIKHIFRMPEFQLY